MKFKFINMESVRATLRFLARVKDDSDEYKPLSDFTMSELQDSYISDGMAVSFRDAKEVKKPDPKETMRKRRNYITECRLDKGWVWEGKKLVPPKGATT